jgi:hypothetical protein
VELRRGDAVCRLSWDGLAGGGWAVTYFVCGRYETVRGTAIALPAQLDAGATAVWSRTRTVRNRFRRLSGPHGPIVPLRVGWVTGTGGAERDTLAQLCRLLADDAATRSRLKDPGAVAALVRDLATGAQQNRSERTGVRRTAFEILNALRMLGYRHRNGGRPDPGWTADVETVVADVRRSLATNPYVRGLHFPEERIRSEVRREYADVEPWPFAALTAPARARG